VEVYIGDANNYQLPQDESRLKAYTLDGSEILESDLKSWMMNGDDSPSSDFAIFHTPGHSVGSLTLYRRPSHPSEQVESPGIIFTGDTYAHTTRGGGAGRMTAFPRYGNNHFVQSQSLQRLLFGVNWHVVAPGHGHPRDYRESPENNKEKEMDDALQELGVSGRIRRR
jgi:glyoxylase-like metal-dependent hydrolase (beta-lactamase superfamily II)